MSSPDIVVRRIVRDYMGLTDPRIFLTGENIMAPTDDQIFVVVGSLAPLIVGTGVRFDPETEDEISQVSTATTVNIDVCSRNKDADFRYFEAVAAIRSTLAQQIMEQEGMSIYRNPNILNLTAVEGAGTLRRHRIQVIIFHVMEKTVPIADVFDNFQTPEVNNG